MRTILNILDLRHPLPICAESHIMETDGRFPTSLSVYSHAVLHRLDGTQVVVVTMNLNSLITIVVHELHFTTQTFQLSAVTLHL
jgi:hypothetical protein